MRETLSKILNRNGIVSETPAVLFDAGQVNAVYDINGKFVLKVEKSLDVTAHQPEVMRLALQAGAKVPEVIDAGTSDGVSYLLMAKMPGQRLSSGWFNLTKNQQESMLSQIVEQLKIFHGIPFDAYAIPRPLQNNSWQDALHVYTDIPEQSPEQADERTRANFATIRSFYLDHEALLAVATPPVLVHNDIHFDNILHQDGVLTGVLDFDFARQAPMDYELRQIIDFFQAPKYLVSERDEQAWGGFVATDELHVLRKYYPELFDSPDIIARQKLYLTETIINAMRDGAFYKFNEKVEAYFKTDWLQRVLS